MLSELHLCFQNVLLGVAGIRAWVENHYPVEEILFISGGNFPASARVYFLAKPGAVVITSERILFRSGWLGFILQLLYWIGIMVVCAIVENPLLIIMASLWFVILIWQALPYTVEWQYDEIRRVEILPIGKARWWNTSEAMRVYLQDDREHEVRSFTGYPDLVRAQIGAQVTLTSSGRD